MVRYRKSASVATRSAFKLHDFSAVSRNQTNYFLYNVTVRSLYSRRNGVTTRDYILLGYRVAIASNLGYRGTRPLLNAMERNLQLFQSKGRVVPVYTYMVDVLGVMLTVAII